MDTVLAFLRDLLTAPSFLWIWAAMVAASLAVLVRDLRARNRGIAPLMKAVWVLTVLYSGPLGLAIYWGSGRRQIASDSLWRRAWRSVAHCYSGCGAGEVVGVSLAAGVLALATGWVAAITFGFAYLFGYALTVGPLVQEGVGWGEATIGEPLFWSGLVFSLTLGLLAAYPVNVLLIRVGVKEGMGDPRSRAA